VRTRTKPQLIRAELRVLASAGLLVFTHLSPRDDPDRRRGRSTDTGGRGGGALAQVRKL